MSAFEQELQSILEGVTPLKPIPEDTVKTASQTVHATASTEGLRKLASILRKTKVDPTYQELYSFVEGMFR
jgi:hypothetical protein